MRKTSWAKNKIQKCSYFLLALFHFFLSIGKLEACIKEKINGLPKALKSNKKKIDLSESGFRFPLSGVCSFLALTCRRLHDVDDANMLESNQRIC